MNKTKKGLLIGTGIVLAVAAAVFTGTYLKLHKEVNAIAEDVIWENIYVGDIDASGMKADDIKAAVKKKIAEYKEEKVDLQLGMKKIEVTLGDLGFEAENLEEAVAEAIAYGKTGSTLERYKMLKELEAESLSLEVGYRICPEITRDLLLAFEEELEIMPQDATLTRMNGEFVITEDVQGIGMDVQRSVEMLTSYFDEKWTPKKSGCLELIADVQDAVVTSEELSKVKDMLGTFTTEFESGNARARNIENATSRINGKVMLPGEELSASDAMGSRTAENGYYPAGSYLSGEVVDSIGGGVCQVSTTLYNAILEAELEVTERCAHSMTVSYVLPSKDAAIAEGYKDLRFKNNTDTPIYIEGYVENGSVTFTIYGLEMREDSRRVEYVSKTLETTEAVSRFIEDKNAALGITKKSSGHEGKKSELWKIIYENGEEISRERINTSHYMMSPHVYCVGTASDNKEAAEFVRKAISSQSRSKIEAAIDNAKEMIEKE